MAEIVKIKVSSLTEAVSLDSLVVLGVDGANNSVKVPILLLKGNKGDDGADGTEIELQKSSTHLQWRYVGGSWVDLVALADLKGAKGDTGANIELQKSATHLQWRVSGTATWNDLVALADIKGDKGDTGEGFIIKGYYNTLSALQLAVTNPNAGDAYGVGNTAPFDIYVYDSVSSAWVNNGALQGPAGASSYTYIAYASNDEGADFSLSDGAYIAIKTTTTPIASPVAADFAGLWKQFRFTGTANIVAKSDGTKLVDSSIVEVDGKVGIGNAPDAGFDTVGSVLNRGSANHYRDVVMYSVNASPAGTAKITLPQFGNTIFSMRIFGCQNNAQAVWEVIIGGEMNSAGTIHVSLTRAQINGPAPFSSVRVGSDGTKPVILLGTTSTAWVYPHIVVTDFIASYSNKSGFGSGWALDIISTESGLTAGAVAVSSLLNSNTLRVGVGSDYSSNPNALLRNYHGYVHGAELFGQTDGGILSTWHSDEWQHQIFGDFRTGQVAVRGKQSDAWQPWRIVWDSGNLNPSLLTFLTSQSTVTTLASLPVTKRVIVASVTAATTLSLAAALDVGRELHIKVYNTSGSAITQPLPTSTPFESKKVDGTNISSISIPAGGSVEISILSVTDKYIIKTDA